MLIRTLLIDGSTSTLSSWFRETVSGFSMTSGEDFASISGTLCRSDAWDAKSESESAAVSVERTHERYGRSDWDMLVDVLRGSRMALLLSHLGERRCVARFLWR